MFAVVHTVRVQNLFEQGVIESKGIDRSPQMPRLAYDTGLSDDQWEWMRLGISHDAAIAADNSGWVGSPKT